MEMNDRKKKILQAIVDDYISTAEPVGSRTVARRHELGLSSATIRNEMSDLEEMGYLDKPHTSAGRVPSPLGYKLYVEELMQQYRMSMQEVNQMYQAMNARLSELSGLMEQAANVISRMTAYMAVTSLPQVESALLKQVHLLYLDEHALVLIVMLASGLVKNRTVRIHPTITPQTVEHLSRYLDDSLSGRGLQEIDREFLEALSEKCPVELTVLGPVIEELLACLKDCTDESYFLSGTSRMFDFPEYNDFGKAKKMLEFFETKQNLGQMLHRMHDGGYIQKGNIRIFIGQDWGISELDNMSVITSEYKSAKGLRGTIGLIGPTRMDYAKAISSMEYLTSAINKILDRDPVEEEKGNQ